MKSDLVFKVKQNPYYINILQSSAIVKATLVSAQIFACCNGPLFDANRPWTNELKWRPFSI